MRKLGCLLIVLAIGTTAVADYIIGNPTAANGWSTTSAVSVSVAPNVQQYPTEDSSVNVINGSGLDAATGLIHNDQISGMTFQKNGVTTWFNNNYTYYGDERPWWAFEFDQVYDLKEINIWNYNLYSTNGYDWAISKIAYDWSIDGVTWYTRASNLTAPSPDLDADVDYNGAYDIIEEWMLEGAYNADYTPVNGEIYVGGTKWDTRAKYVILTARNTFNGPLLGSTKNCGLSEVQFVVPEPATIALLGFGALALIRRRP